MKLCKLLKIVIGVPSLSVLGCLWSLGILGFVGCVWNHTRHKSSFLCCRYRKTVQQGVGRHLLSGAKFINFSVS